jgi:hypothetical protein
MFLAHQGCGTKNLQRSCGFDKTYFYPSLAEREKEENSMRFLSCFFGVLLCLTGLLPVTPVAAVSLGQSDTFEDGTTQGWMVGLLGSPHPAPPDNIASGGPAGVDDNYLLLTAVGGNGPGSKLSVINLAQWAGDYPAAGVGAILMDVNNFGNSDLSLRLLVADPTGGPPTNLAFSTDPIFVPAQSGWQQVKFPFTASDLTAGSGSVNAALTQATELRIYHSTAAVFPSPVSPIDPVVVQLGVDNIAAAVPLPASLLLVGSGLMCFLGLKRKICR